MLHHGRIDLCWFLPVLLGRFRDRLRLDSLPIHLIDPAADRISAATPRLASVRTAPAADLASFGSSLTRRTNSFLTLATVSRSFASRISC